MKKIFLIALTFLLIACAALVYDILTNKSSNYPNYINESTIHTPPENGMQFVVMFASANQGPQILQLMEARKKEFDRENISISKHGDHAIVIEIPDFVNADKGLNIINRRPSLEIKLLDATRKDMDTVLNSKATITTDDIKNVKVEYGKDNKPVIYLTLTEDAAWNFYDITRENVGKKMLLIVDGRIVGMPIIKEGISKGVVRIEGEYEQSQETVLAGLMYSAIHPPTYYADAMLGKRSQSLSSDYHLPPAR